MLKLPCPFCGMRDETEFHYGGEPRRRPGPAEQVSDADWADYLFNKRNDKGVHEEIWHHLGGCRRWFLVSRDTRSHAVLSTRLPGAHAPGDVALGEGDAGEVQP
jgi:heterotetrameric sarcosine oxidase delta subunit